MRELPVRCLIPRMPTSISEVHFFLISLVSNEERFSLNIPGLLPHSLFPPEKGRSHQNASLSEEIHMHLVAPSLSPFEKQPTHRESAFWPGLHASCLTLWASLWLFSPAWVEGHKALAEVQCQEVHCDHISKPHSPVQFLSALSSYFDLHLSDFIVYLSVVSKLGRKNVIYGVIAELNCWENYVSHRAFILLIFIVSH